MLEGEWKAWSVLDTMPEELRGIYGGDARNAEADVGVRLAEKSIGFTDGGTTVAIEQVVAWVDKPGTVFLRKSRFADVGCTGSMTRTDDNLVLALTPVEGLPQRTRFALEHPAQALARGHARQRSRDDHRQRR